MIYKQPSLFKNGNGPVHKDWTNDIYKNTNMDTALIFGVTGQDGSYLSELLIEQGWNVIGVARRVSTDNKQNIQHLLNNKFFTLVEGDITDQLFVNEIISNKKPAHIYNLAAMSHVATSFKQPVYTFNVIALGSLNILNTIKTLKDNTGYSPAYYHASTSEMFGDSFTENISTKHLTVSDILSYTDNQDISTLRFQNEQTSFNPRSPYAVAKLAAHLLGCIYRDSYNMFICNGILFNHESSRRGENFVTRKITKYVGKLKRDLENRSVGEDYPKLKLGNIESYRDFGYAPEYCEAMFWMMLQQRPDDYVICTGKTYQVKEFLDKAFRYIGIIGYESFVEIDKDLFRPAEVPFLKGSYEKAQKIFGWSPKVGLDELVKIMVDNDYEKSL